MSDGYPEDTVDTDEFADVMASTRLKINQKREDLTSEKTVIERLLLALDREEEAVTAYEYAKAGKLQQLLSPAKAKAKRGSSNGASTGTRAPRGSKRATISQLLSDNPDGLVRAEILDRLDVKGDKNAEMSVSNALTSMVKNNTLARIDGRYTLAA